MKLIRFILIINILFIIGCDKNDSNPSNSSDPQNQTYSQLYPLQVGNEWVYETTEFQTTNLITDTIRCIGKYFDNGDSVFSFNGGKKDYDIRTAYFQLDENMEGLFYRRDSLFMFTKDNQNNTMYKHFVVNFDPVLGQQLTIYYKGCGKLGVLRVDATENTITVPAGVFTCIRFSLVADSCAAYTFWISKDVGIVRLKSGDDAWDKVELVSYKIN